MRNIILSPAAVPLLCTVFVTVVVDRLPPALLLRVRAFTEVSLEYPPPKGRSVLKKFFRSSNWAWKPRFRHSNPHVEDGLLILWPTNLKCSLFPGEGTYRCHFSAHSRVEISLSRLETWHKHKIPHRLCLISWIRLQHLLGEQTEKPTPLKSTTVRSFHKSYNYLLYLAMDK